MVSSLSVAREADVVPSHDKVAPPPTSAILMPSTISVTLENLGSVAPDGTAVADQHENAMINHAVAPVGDSTTIADSHDNGEALLVLAAVSTSRDDTSAATQPISDQTTPKASLMTTIAIDPTLLVISGGIAISAIQDNHVDSMGNITPSDLGPFAPQGDVTVPNNCPLDSVASTAPPIGSSLECYNASTQCDDMTLVRLIVYFP